MKFKNPNFIFVHTDGPTSLKQYASSTFSNYLGRASSKNHLCQIIKTSGPEVSDKKVF